MSGVKWTPGPWSRCDAESIVGESGHGWFVRVCDKRVISVEGRTEDEADANANLIAAAPDLYEALKKSFDAICALPIDALGVVQETHDCPAYPIRDELLHEVFTALAKARGES